jgi:hypothetical protein
MSSVMETISILSRLKLTKRHHQSKVEMQEPVTRSLGEEYGERALRKARIKLRPVAVSRRTTRRHSPSATMDAETLTKCAGRVSDAHRKNATATTTSVHAIPTASRPTP